MTAHSVSWSNTMYRQLTEQAERYLRSLYQQDDIAGELKRKLADLMARGEANADAACRALKLSRRTLQRRLKAEKTSFQRFSRKSELNSLLITSRTRA